MLVILTLKNQRQEIDCNFEAMGNIARCCSETEKNSATAIIKIILCLTRNTFFFN